MDEHVPSEHFVRELTRGQNGVFAYILSLVGNPDAARDVLKIVLGGDLEPHSYDRLAIYPLTL